TVTLGSGLTVTVPEPEPEQVVLPSVTVQVYMVVLEGETMMDAVVAPPGLQEYVGEEAPVVAVSVAVWPLQIVGEFTATLGRGLTVSVAAALVAADPQPLSTTTV